MKPLAITITHALAALGLAGAAMTPALAGEPERMTISVTTADIDLATVKGQKTLDQRLRRAVRNVCRPLSANTGSHLPSREALACLAQARADVKQQIAALTSRNEQRGG
jgi:UrcA family protein